MNEKELLALIIQLASLEKFVKEHAPLTYQAWKAQNETK